MGVQDSRVETYNWYVPGSHYTLVTVTYDTAGSATGTPYVSGATYYVMPRNTTGITNVNARITGATAYPNPAASELHIAFNLPNVAGASITITNLVGSVVETIDASQMKEGANDITVPVSSLPTGLYLVRIQNGVSEVSQKVVINH